MTSARGFDLSAPDAPLRAARVPVPPAKRLLDIVAAAILLVLCAPVFVVIALVVRSDGGPVLFRQRRVGAGGQVFQLPKFRSMAVDAEHRLCADPDVYARYVTNGFKLARDEDTRVTRWGDFLRSTHLDELPQLVTVLRGEMSMVGP
ncbi:MAG: sugar transferase, partial [Ilumatobacteraceae bacterium]